MDALTARPHILKQANLTLIRRVIKNNFTATRAEIAEQTKISSTTVRSLLTEMLQRGEIESIGYDLSSGGRKAERYRFAPNRYFGAVFCIADRSIQFLLLNVCGEIVEESAVQTAEENAESAIIDYLDDLLKDKDIRAVGIGVPGVVDGGGYFRKNIATGELYKNDIGDRLFKRYNIPIVLENNINATALGLEHHMLKHSGIAANIAYINFKDSCIKASFIADGKVVRGSRNFAGEIGLLRINGTKSADEYLTENTDNADYTQFVVELLSWVSGILNPEYIFLGGDGFREQCLQSIEAGLSKRLECSMRPKLKYFPNTDFDYHDGMAHLTAGKMFEEIQFVKE